jgi:hypothetical protein
MTRVIKARALTAKDHIGVIASHDGAATPREIFRLPIQSLTFVFIEWVDGTATSVHMDDDITIHEPCSQTTDKNRKP